jgi:hypothetical protein
MPGAMRKLPLLLIISLFLGGLSCQKSELEIIRINGTVSDSRSSIGLAGATLILQSTSVSGGVYHGDFAEVGRVNSDNAGNYEFSIETEKAVAYRILLEAPLYFGLSRDFDPPLLTKPEAARVDFSLDPMSWINLRVNNTTPWDNDDLISFSFQGEFNACTSCCNSSIIKGEGPVYAYAGLCPCPGGQVMQIKWSVTKKGNTKLYQDSLQVQPFDTMSYQINY